MEINVTISYPDRNNITVESIVPADLKIYVDKLESEFLSTDKLYSLISFSLYEDKDVWRTLPIELFREEILRHFYNEKEINEKNTI